MADSLLLNGLFHDLFNPCDLNPRFSHEKVGTLPQMRPHLTHLPYHSCSVGCYGTCSTRAVGYHYGFPIFVSFIVSY